MAKRRVHLQHLIGREVHDSAGKRVGHIEEFRAIQDGERCYVDQYQLGEEGLALRLSIPHLASLLIRPFGPHNQPSSQSVPWQQMDLTDPKHPRLRCTKEELDEMQPKYKDRDSSKES